MLGSFKIHGLLSGVESDRGAEWSDLSGHVGIYPTTDPCGCHRDVSYCLWMEGETSTFPTVG